jgi:hypothetical protein
MEPRTIKDRLREEYFELLPDIHRVVQSLETQVRHCLLPISRHLEKHEVLVVTSRVKDCASAVTKRLRRQEARLFDPDQPEAYSLTDLPDLAGVRVLAFPRRRRDQVNDVLRREFSSWEPAPFDNAEGAGFKYCGYCEEVSHQLRCELQIVSRLVGLFWEVEHAAVYKPPPAIAHAVNHPRMQKRRRDVMAALGAFEDEFERLVSTEPTGEG